MKLIYVLLFSLYVQLINAQIQDSLRDDLALKMNSQDLAKFRIADSYYKNLEYLMALPIYDSLYTKYNNTYLGYLLGCCFIFESHYSSKSEELIVKAGAIKKFLPDYYYYYGLSLVANNKYRFAKEQFNKYLNHPISNELKQYISSQIETCDNNINAKEKKIQITNLGQNINTEGSEYSPVFPTNNEFMLYTYKGTKSVGGKQLANNKKDEKGLYFEDVYISYIDKNGHFSPGIPVDELNTNSHESVSYVSQDGNKIYLYKNLTGSGDIFFSKKLPNGKWSKPEPVKGICSSNWEGSCYFSPDENTFYFSSDRPGGLGGRDIWKSELLDNGKFSKPVNIGPSINTASDEDTPFITSDGKYFYFSSNDSKKSIGGYDIFKSEIKENTFSEPLNIGKPLNTSRDDKYLVISPNGKKAYFNSDHIEGFGQQDIYEIDRTNLEPPIPLVKISGKITSNNTPVISKLNVISLINKNFYNGEFNSNGSGIYQMILPAKTSYEISVEYNNRKMSKILSLPVIDTLVSLELNFEIDELQTVYNDSMRIVDSLDFKPELSLEDFYTRYKDFVFPNTIFKVQVAAYKMNPNFNYGKLVGFPKLEKSLYKDQITRYTIGNFEKFEEAYLLLQKARRTIAQDAFIIAIQNNKRMLLKDLIK